MNLLLALGAVLVAIVLGGVFYGMLMDPRRIGEEEDQAVDQASPAARRGFLERFRRRKNNATANQMADLEQTDFPADTGSDISPDT